MWSKDKVFLFKMSMDLPRSGVDFVKCTRVLKGFMMDNVHIIGMWLDRSIWMATEIYPWSFMNARVFFHWSSSLYKVTQKYIKLSLQLQHKHIYKDYKDTQTTDEVETKYCVNSLMVVVIWSCHGRLYFWYLWVVEIMADLLHAIKVVICLL